MLAVHAVARDGLAAAQPVEQAAGAHVHGRRWGPRCPCSSWVQRPRIGDAVGVLEADDGGAVGAQQAPGVERHEREDARGRRAGGDRGRHAPQRGLLLGHAPLGGLELARPAGGAGQQLAPGHDDAADEAVDRHDDDELAREVALYRVAVVERAGAHGRRRRPASRRAPGAGGRRRPRRRRRTTGSRAPASRCRPVTRVSAATTRGLRMVETCDRRTGECAHGDPGQHQRAPRHGEGGDQGDGPQRWIVEPGRASVSRRVTAPLSHSTPLTRLARASSPGLASRSWPHDDISARSRGTQTSSSQYAHDRPEPDHQRCSAGHQKVVRPPTVARCISVAAARAQGAAPARGDHVAGVGAAAADRRAHRGAHLAAQAVELRGAQPTGRAARIQAARARGSRRPAGCPRPTRRPGP